MKNLIIIIMFCFITACTTTEKIVYEEKEILVPKIIVESCVTDKITMCDKYINDNKDLVECYLYNESQIIKYNKLIDVCNE